MIIIPGPASESLGRKVAELLKTRVGSLEFKRFPDGEAYIRLNDNLDGEDVVIVQTTGPPQNENLIQLFLIVEASNDLNARTINLVIPYFAYSRQDKCFRSGEAFSLKTMLTLMNACGVDRIITVNSHNPEIMKSFGLPVEDLSAIKLLAKHFKKRGFEGAFSLGLGKKALDVAKQADDVLRGGYSCVNTRRDRTTGKVEIEREPLPIQNKDVIIFDDIISSGGTMAEAVKLAREMKGRRVISACVHPLLVGDALDRIRRSGADEIVGTDCVSSPVSAVSVAPLIAEALAKLVV